jgi:hypothetical protein
MDEILEVVEVAADFGFGEAFAWLLRVVGLVVLLAGAAMWLLTDAGLLVLPALLMGLGVVLLVVPSVLLAGLELLG